MNGLLLQYDPEADALYVSFRELRPGEGRGSREIDESRFVAYDYDDQIVGVEFLNVRDGIVLEGVPRAEDIRQAIERLLDTRLVSKSAA